MTLKNGSISLRGVKGSTAITVGAGLAAQFLTLLTGMLAARMVGVDGRGAIAACTIAALIMASLGELGAPISFTYFSAKSVFSSTQLIAITKIAVPVLSLLSILVAVLATTLAYDFTSDLQNVAIVFTCLYIPTQMLGRHINALNQGQGRFLIFNLARVSGQLTNVILLIAAMLLGKSSIAWCVSAIAAGSVVMMLLACYGQRENLGRRRASWLTAKEVYSYGLKAHLGTVSPLDSYRLDLAVVLLLTTTYGGGLYAAAIGIATVIRAQATTIGLVAVPSIAKQSRFADQIGMAKRFGALVVLSVAIISVILFSFMGPLVALIYGSEFEPAIDTARILIVAMFIGSVRQVVQDSARGFGAPGIGSTSELVAWLSCLVLLPSLVRRFGIEGAAVGICISYALALMVASWLLLNWIRSNHASRPQLSRLEPS